MIVLVPLLAVPVLLQPSAATVLPPAALPRADEESAGRERVPGTRVSLVPPQAFTPAEHFPGFQHEKAQASLQVTELASSFAEVAAEFADDEALMKRGMRVVRREQKGYGEAEGLTLDVEQEARGAPAIRVLWLFAADGGSVLVQGTCPEAVRDRWLPRIREAVYSARVEDVEVDPLEGIPFQLTHTGGLERTDMRVGNMLAYAQGGDVAGGRSGKPVLLVGPSVEPAVGQHRAFARRRIRAVGGIAKVKIDAVEDVTIDDLEGVAVRAHAVDASTSTPLALYQVVLFEVDHYWSMLGMCGTDVEDPWMREFRRITANFRRTSAER